MNAWVRGEDNPYVVEVREFAEVHEDAQGFQSVHVRRCPACGIKVGYDVDVRLNDHLEQLHGPADFGLSPVRDGRVVAPGYPEGNDDQPRNELGQFVSVATDGSGSGGTTDR